VPPCPVEEAHPGRAAVTGLLSGFPNHTLLLSSPSRSLAGDLRVEADRFGLDVVVEDGRAPVRF